MVLESHQGVGAMGVFALQEWLDGWFLTTGIHRNGRIHGFPADFCTVKRTLICVIPFMPSVTMNGLAVRWGFVLRRSHTQSHNNHDCLYC